MTLLFRATLDDKWNADWTAENAGGEHAAKTRGWGGPMQGGAQAGYQNSVRLWHELSENGPIGVIDLRVGMIRLQRRSLVQVRARGDVRLCGLS
jgi:hypothetical protein